MKIKTIEKEKSVMSELRTVRDKISHELSTMTTAEIVEYLKSKKTLHPANVWQKKD